MSNFLSVVVPAYKRPYELEKCLDSIHNHADMPFELILHDDAQSFDESRWTSRDDDMPLSEKASVFLQSKGKNVGLSRAANRCISVASSDTIFFINADMTVNAPCFRKLYSLAQRPWVGIVFPMLKVPDNNSKVVCLNGFGAGGAQVFRKEVWSDIGWFNENVGSGNSDVSFIGRVLRYGYFTSCIPESTCKGELITHLAPNDSTIHGTDNNHPHLFNCPNLEELHEKHSNEANDNMQMHYRMEQGDTNIDYWHNYMNRIIKVSGSTVGFDWKEAELHGQHIWREQVEHAINGLRAQT